MDSLFGAIGLLLLVFSSPVLASMFGSPLFIPVALLCCFISLGLFLAGQPYLGAAAWFGTWLVAAIGVAKRREHRQITREERQLSRMRRAIGKLYVAALHDRGRGAMRGKNRALR